MDLHGSGSGPTALTKNQKKFLGFFDNFSCLALNNICLWVLYYHLHHITIQTILTFTIIHYNISKPTI